MGWELWDAGNRGSRLLRHRRDQLLPEIGRVSKDPILDLDELALGQLRTSVLHLPKAVTLLVLMKCIASV